MQVDSLPPEPQGQPQGTRKRTNKPKISRSEEIIKIRAEIETGGKKKKKTEQINASKNWFFEKKKTDRPLARLIKKKKRA